MRLAAEQHNARLLVVDTLGVAYGASEIDRAQVGAFFADWAAWADEHDCAVLLIAHPPKTAGVTYSGSTGILGGVRAMWTLETVSGGNAAATAALRETAPASRPTPIAS